jgi:hypothetical protein
MKTLSRTIFVVMVICLSGSATLIAQPGRGMHGMRGTKTDTLRMPHDRMDMWMAPDSADMRMMRNHMRQMMKMHDEMWFGPMWRMHSPMGQWYGYGQGRGHGWGPQRDFRYNRRGFDHQPPLEAIPNLTDKQKKDIADLRQKHMDEMKKFREDMQAKMNEMRDAYRKNIDALLTTDQKKYLEDNKPEPPAKK